MKDRRYPVGSDVQAQHPAPRTEDAARRVAPRFFAGRVARQALKGVLGGTFLGGGLGLGMWAMGDGAALLGSHALDSKRDGNPYRDLPAVMIEERRQLEAFSGVRFRGEFTQGTADDYAHALPGIRTPLGTAHCIVAVPAPPEGDVCSESEALSSIGRSMCVDPLWGLELGKRQLRQAGAEALFVLHHEEMHCLFDHAEGLKRDIEPAPSRVSIDSGVASLLQNEIDAAHPLDQWKHKRSMAILDNESAADLYASLRTLQSGRPDLVELVANQRWNRAAVFDDRVHATGALLDELMMLHDSGALEAQAQQRFGTAFKDLSAPQVVEWVSALRAEGLRYSAEDQIVIASGCLSACRAGGTLIEAVSHDALTRMAEAIGAVADMQRRADGLAADALAEEHAEGAQLPEVHHSIGGENDAHLGHDEGPRW